ncbi:hypothetical protein Tco_0561148, partial [Tanacetum coccineum]
MESMIAKSQVFDDVIAARREVMQNTMAKGQILGGAVAIGFLHKAQTEIYARHVAHGR